MFYGKAQFSQSLGWFARNSEETLSFHKLSRTENQVKLRYFTKCFFKVYLHLSLLFDIKGYVPHKKIVLVSVVVIVKSSNRSIQNSSIDYC